MTTLAFDMGGTRIKYGLVKDGKAVWSDVCETHVEEGYEAVVARMAALAAPLLRQETVRAVGVASPGLIETERGTVCCSNNFGWDGRPLARDLGAKLSRPVRVANDAQCAALGEARYGAGRGCSRVAMLTLGTGVGGGFVCNGRGEVDRYGSMAYIFGHTVIDRGGRPCSCGRRGCLEAYASATAVARQGSQALGRAQSAKEVFEAARAGNRAARAVVDDFLEALTQGTINIANTLRPQKIVIGGGMAASADMILPAVNAGLEKEVYGYTFAPVRAVRAQLGDLAGIVGAATLWEETEADKR